MSRFSFAVALSLVAWIASDLPTQGQDKAASVVLDLSKGPFRGEEETGRQLKKLADLYWDKTDEALRENKDLLARTTRYLALGDSMKQSSQKRQGLMTQRQKAVKGEFETTTAFQTRIANMDAEIDGCAKAEAAASAEMVKIDPRGEIQALRSKVKIPVTIKLLTYNPKYDADSNTMVSGVNSTPYLLYTTPVPNRPANDLGTIKTETRVKVFHRTQPFSGITISNIPTVEVAKDLKQCLTNLDRPKGDPVNVIAIQGHFSLAHSEQRKEFVNYSRVIQGLPPSNDISVNNEYTFNLDGNPLSVSFPGIAEADARQFKVVFNPKK